jgi:hypothetical protein
MSRLVVETQASPENAASRIVKYIPSEAIAFYVVVENIVRTLGSDAAPSASGAIVDSYIKANGPFILFFATWLLIPFYIALQKSDKNEKSLLQTLVGLLLFPIWIYAINGIPFDAQHWNLHSSVLAAILLAVATLVSGVIPNILSPSDFKVNWALIWKRRGPLSQAEVPAE